MRRAKVPNDWLRELAENVGGSVPPHGKAGQTEKFPSNVHREVVPVCSVNAHGVVAVLQVQAVAPVVSPRQVAETFQRFVAEAELLAVPVELPEVHDEPPLVVTRLWNQKELGDPEGTLSLFESSNLLKALYLW